MFSWRPLTGIQHHRIHLQQRGLLILETDWTGALWGYFYLKNRRDFCKNLLTEPKVKGIDLEKVRSRSTPTNVKYDRFVHSTLSTAQKKTLVSNPFIYKARPLQGQTLTAGGGDLMMEVEGKPVGDIGDDRPQAVTVKGGLTLSKRAQKRLSRSQQYKELKKQKKADSLHKAQNDDIGFKDADFNQTEYFFENGLRKVLPYNYVFSTYAKGRWVGRKLFEVLATEFGYDHPDELTNAFKLGKIHVNNMQASEDHVIRDCDYISHRTHRHENCVSGAPLQVLHDSEDVVVINKPSSIPCHPCGRYRFNSVVFIMGKEMGYNNLRNIYRLDRLTSGVLILGKTSQHTKLLEDQVQQRLVQKEYVCRVEGRFPDGEVRVDQPLKALSNKLRLQVVDPTGKASQTQFERISYNGTSSVVKCRPTTGRTHQIRVHLQYLGHPILNDGFYNNQAWGPNKGRGGIYEVPHAQVCERILLEHNVNLWDGGANPLYYNKLEEHQKAKVAREKEIGSDARCETTLSAPVISPFREGEPSSEPSSKKSKMEGAESTRILAVCESSKSLDKGEVTSESVSRIASDATETGSDQKGKITENLWEQDKLNAKTLSTMDKTETTNSFNFGPQDSSPAEGISLSSLIEISPAGVRDSSSSHTDVVAAEVSSSSSSQPAVRSVESGEAGCLAGQSEKTTVTSGQSEKTTVTSGQSETTTVTSGQQWEAIQLDCELCKKRPLDPQPKHLVMFLHALKYKGPGWEYESPLPDWAQEDWRGEDDFIL